MSTAGSVERAHEPGDAAPRRRSRRPAWGKLAVGAVILGALAAAWQWTPLSDYLAAERVATWARTLRDVPWAPVAVMLAYVPAAFVMFPRPVLTLFGVIAFGPWLGFVYGMAGILLSAVATYYAGRALSPATVRRLAGDKLDDVNRALRRHGLLAVFAIRIVPVAPFLVESIVAGAARVKLWHYTLGTFGGMLPGVLATTVFGDQIATALEDTSKINYGLIAAIVLVFIAMTWYVKRWFQKSGER